MLGLLVNLLRQTGLVVPPGGVLSDGDWAKMTSVDWDAVGASNNTVWSDWDATDDD